MSLFDLGFVVSALSTATVTVRRLSAPGYGADGRALPRTVTSFTARGSWQPLSGADLKRDIEGLNILASKSLWLTATLALGDEVQDGAERFQVKHVDAWAAGGNYTKAICQMLDPREV